MPSATKNDVDDEHDKDEAEDGQQKLGNKIDVDGSDSAVIDGISLPAARNTDPSILIVAHGLNIVAFSAYLIKLGEIWLKFG